MRSAICLVLVTASALALGACGSTAPGPTPPPSGSATTTTGPGAPPPSDPGDDVWAAVAAQYPAAVRPEVEVIRETGPAELNVVLADCLHDAGFLGATPTVDGGLDSGEIPEEQAEAYAVAEYACRVQYPLESRYLEPLDAEQIGTLYDYYVGDMTACLAEQGLAVEDVPSRDVFVETYPSTPWSPLAGALQGQDYDTYLAVAAACPQLPEDLYE